MTSPPSPDPAPSAGPNRRAVLAGTGVAAAGAVVGFAGYTALRPRNEPPVTEEPTGGYPDPAVPEDSGVPVVSDYPAGATALAQLSAVPENGGVVLTDREIVLTRGAGDTVRAFSAVCTHQGCLVNAVADGRISCPCHGSAFDASSGEPVAGPARRPLDPVPVAVVDGSIVQE